MMVRLRKKHAQQSRASLSKYLLRQDCHRLLPQKNSSMSSILVKWIANRFLKDNQLTKFGVEDPYYEYVEVGTLANGLPKLKKVKRKVPQGISSHDITILNSVKKQAYRYDMWFTLFGLRIGWSNIVGFVPIAGALITNYWSLKLFFDARKLEDGLPLDIQLIFVFNIVVDFLLSLVPIVGDIIEIGYKANLRNFLLLEKHLARVGQKNLGLILELEVRPGFINDKVQPYVDDTIVPGAVNAGKQIKKFVNSNIKAARSSSIASNATTQSSEATAVGMVDTSHHDDDTKSIRSLKELL